MRWKQKYHGMKEIRGVHPYRSLDEDDSNVMAFEEEVKKRKKMWKRPKIIAILISAILIFVIVISTLVYAALIHRSRLDETRDTDRTLPVAHTSCGKVVGVKEQGIFKFLGVPYAKPPVGPNGRWKPPRPMTIEDGCWNEELLARRPSPSCTQDDFRSKSPEGETQFFGSEDCLYLNIWTPTLKNDDLKPVIVYIHGGFLRWGSGLEPTFIPTAQLIRQYDAVIVTINYRLYALGFLTLNVLSSASPNGKSGNYGLLDQIMALRWVRENIRSFGGNPEKVTLLGQGSGATSIVGLLTSPLALNLFQGAWLSSPSPFINTSMQDASQNNIKLLKENCTTLKCLNSLSAEQVQAMALKYWDCHDCYNLPVLGSFDSDLLVVDGEVIPFPTLDSISHEVTIDVPIVIGSMAQEVDSFPPSGIRYWEMDSFNNFVASHLDTFGNNLTAASIQIYNDSQTIGSSSSEMELAVTTMISDVREVCPTNHLASAIQNSFTSPVFRYVATRKPSSEIRSGDGCKYACSSWDLVAIFGSTRSYLPDPSMADLQFEQLIQNSLKKFVHQSSVALKQEGWLEIPKIAVIDEHVKYQEGYHEQACKFWMDNGFLQYAWKN